jgi:hypothetical protein
MSAGATLQMFLYHALVVQSSAVQSNQPCPSDMYVLCDVLLTGCARCHAVGHRGTMRDHRNRYGWPWSRSREPRKSRARRRKPLRCNQNTDFPGKPLVRPGVSCCITLLRRAPSGSHSLPRWLPKRALILRRDLCLCPVLCGVVRSIGLRLELRCETLPVLQAITTPAASLQSFLTELTGGQFSSVRDVEGDPTAASGELLSELQRGSSSSSSLRGGSSSSHPLGMGLSAAPATVSTAVSVGGASTRARDEDGFGTGQPSLNGASSIELEQQPGSRLAAAGALNFSGGSSVALLRRWRAIKGA